MTNLSGILVFLLYTLVPVAIAYVIHRRRFGHTRARKFKFGAPIAGLPAQAQPVVGTRPKLRLVHSRSA